MAWYTPLVVILTCSAPQHLLIIVVKPQQVVRPNASLLYEFVTTMYHTQVPGQLGGGTTPQSAQYYLQFCSRVILC